MAAMAARMVTTTWPRDWDIGESKDRRRSARCYSNDSVEKEIAKREYPLQLRAGGRCRRITDQLAHAGSVFPTSRCPKKR